MANNESIKTAKMLRFITVASAFGKRAMDELSIVKSMQQKAAAWRPTLIELMLKANVIEPAQKQAADAALSNHEQTLVLLKNAVTKIAEQRSLLNQKQATDLGRGESEAPSFDPQRSLSSPFVGRHTSEKKASDVAMLRGLGL